MHRHTLKRKAIELGHLEAWFSQGMGSFHFENFEPLRRGLDILLDLTRLRLKGERNALDIMLRRITFELAALPDSFDGFTLLHLSDIHSDGQPGLPGAISRVISRIETDLCLLTGDYRFEISGPCHNVYHAMAEIIGSVKARRGIIGILGNHDFYEEAAELERMGVHMLINQHEEIRRGAESIWIAGVDDPHFYGCHDLATALAGVPRDGFKILLAHSPELFEEAHEHDISLYLCGHTHGGQLCLPFFGPLYMNARCPRTYCAGAWQHKGVTGYTSAGAGSSMVPVRFSCPPEITVIELKKKKQRSTKG